MRPRQLFLAVLLLIAPVQAAQAALPVAAKKIAEKSAIYDITVAYPQTGNKAVDDNLAAWAKSAAADFRKLAKADHQASEQAYVLDTTFKVARNDAAVFAVLFEEYTDTGGAHPNQDYETANFLMPDGWRVYLPELFAAKALPRISALATADLDRRIATGPDATSDPDMVKSGTGADWDNFKDFVLQPNALAIYFPPYQVASYASGPQESHIALSALRDAMRADLRAPAASFDCAQARSAIERTLCSDVGLARLDRQVAESYLLHLRDGTNDAHKDATRNIQRAWLVRRNGACASQASAAAIACLTGVYRERLAALAAEP